MNEPSKTFFIRGGLRHPEPERDNENIEARLDPDSDLVALPAGNVEVVLSVNEIWQLYQWASERLMWEDIYAREDNQDD